MTNPTSVAVPALVLYVLLSYVQLSKGQSTESEAPVTVDGATSGEDNITGAI